MKKIGLFFGSTSDNTKMSSEFMKEYLENEGFSVDMFDIGDIDANKLLEDISSDEDKKLVDASIDQINKNRIN